MIRHLVVLLIGLSAAPCLAAQAVPDEAPLPEAELATYRGGFDLPGGATVTLGVTTVTRIDGRDVLRTVFDVTQAQANLTVLANRTEDGGLTAIDTGAAETRTVDGVVRLEPTSAGVRVVYSGDRIDVSHLAGAALGSIIANSASDRSIEVGTTVDIGLGGLRPDAIGGSLVRVDTLALDATSRMSR